jgi:hypothetical protein
MRDLRTVQRISLDDLIAVAAAAEAAELREESAATPPGRSACIPMSRMSDATVTGLTAAESAHLRACAVCAARRRAFATLTADAQRTPGIIVRGWRLFVGRAVPLAAAAALAFLLWPSRSAPADPERSAGHSVARAVPVSVRYAPHAGGAAEPRVDCFQSTAQEPCVMLALFRTWNSACQCLMWELHQWEDGRTLAEITPGESIDIPFSSANSPPVQQLFVVAVSRERRYLPDRPAETDQLLECLNHSAPPLGTPEDAGAYTSAVSGCLPSGVTVVPAAFTPR